MRLQHLHGITTRGKRIQKLVNNIVLSYTYSEGSDILKDKRSKIKQFDYKSNVYLNKSK